MLELDHTQFFHSVLFQSLGRDIAVQGYQFIAGGNINNVVKLDTSEGPFVVKWNESVPDDFFSKEASGLALLADSGTVNIPDVLAWGSVNGKQYLLLERLPQYMSVKNYWSSLGSAMGALHKLGNQSFGLDYDNYIGSLVQKNTFMDNWIDFYIEQRLEAQLGLAIYNGLVDSAFAKKYRYIYAVLPGELPTEKPSLLHGDFWCGNVVIGHGAKPYLIDPAVYYGHREMDLAFSILFGGFGADFYHAYHEANPLAAGFKDRAGLYQIYPLMVHANLFDASYLSSVERVLTKYR